MTEDRMTRRDLARACAVSERTISEWCTAGLPSLRVGRRTLFEPRAVIAWLATRAAHQRARLDLNEQRSLLAEAQRLRIEHDLRLARREVLPLAEVRLGLQEVAAVAAGGLQALPGRLAAEGVAGQQAAVQAAAKRAVAQTLDDLRAAIRRRAKAHALAAGLARIESEIGGVVPVDEMPD